MTDTDDVIFQQAVKELQSIIDGAEPITRKILKPGEYTNPEVINPVFVALLNYFERHFWRYMRKVPVNVLISTFIGNYDKAFGEFRRTGVLPDKLPDNFGSPATVQKALLFGIERAVLTNKPWPVQWVVYQWRQLKEKLGFDGEARTSINYKAAELSVTEMVEEAESSDQIHGLYKNHTTLTIRPPRRDDEPRENYKFLTSRINPQLKKEMDDVIGNAKSENEKRKKLFNGKDVPSELETRRKAFDAAFKKELGADFNQVREILLSFEQKKPYILRERDIVNQIHKKFGHSHEVIRKVISGLLLTKRKLKQSDTPIWKINRQNNRISRRPIVGLRLWDGHYYLGWSTVILLEILNHFSELMIYRELPEEWVKGSVRIELEKLSNEVSDWFEDEVVRLLLERGFIGRGVIKGLGKGKTQISNPKGQIDFLGYSNDLGLLLVVECKLVKFSTDAGDELGDYRDFIRDDQKPSKKTYSDKLKDKYEWVCSNVSFVMKALQSEFNSIKYGKKIRVAYVMITYHPMRISVFSKDFPQRSVVRFFEDFDAKKDWPYSMGIKDFTV